MIEKVDNVIEYLKKTVKYTNGFIHNKSLGDPKKFVYQSKFDKEDTDSTQIQ